MFVQLTGADGAKLAFNTENIECVLHNADDTTTIRLVSGETVAVHEAYKIVIARLLAPSGRQE